LSSPELQPIWKIETEVNN